MRTKQTIAIIGASGTMGSAIARALAAGPDRLLLCGRDEAKGHQLAAEIIAGRPSADVEGLGCATNACWEADIIILAVPYGVEGEVALKIRDVANQKVVISVSNPVNETFHALLTRPGTSAAEALQQLLPNSKVVKAFNTLFAAGLATPRTAGQQADVLLAGNDAGALDTVATLVRTAGLNPLIAGGLTVSRTTEAMALLLIRLALRHRDSALAGWSVLHN